MDFYYSDNKNVQFLVSLLKAHGIKKVIASPGTTNLELMASLQHDEYFEMYSCVDERSAAYMACGLAAESKQPVMITCTEATASRDYYPALTEAYHRKLPILVVTGLHDYTCIGNLEPQVIDRSVSPLDTMKLKVNLPIIKDETDEWYSILKINQAILELTRHGGGPVHINIPWGGLNMDFSVKNLPNVNVIHRYFLKDELPEISARKIIVFVGGHPLWGERDVKILETFCENYNAIVLCDHASKYYGNYRIQGSLIASQDADIDVLENADLLIHIGEESADDVTKKMVSSTREVWRVNLDGEIRDTFKKLKNVFEMGESDFFEYYNLKEPKTINIEYYLKCKDVETRLSQNIPELPFSSIYVASKISSVLPSNSTIHFGLSDSIRAWNFFALPDSVISSCNSGCRGIDGCVSSLIGASLYDSNKLYFGIYGDLTFFYDMNSLGNRHIKNNVRILIVNNDGGNIFRHLGHPSQKWLGYERANMYICAGGHFGKQSQSLVKNYSENLGFEYMTASNKEEFENCYIRFTSKEVLEKPIVFEVFTECKNDNEAFSLMTKIEVTKKTQAKEAIKSILGEQGTTFLKKIIKR